MFLQSVRLHEDIAFLKTFLNSFVEKRTILYSMHNIEKKFSDQNILLKKFFWQRRCKYKKPLEKLMSRKSQSKSLSMPESGTKNYFSCIRNQFSSKSYFRYGKCSFEKLFPPKSQHFLCKCPIKGKQNFQKNLLIKMFLWIFRSLQS